MGWVHMTARCMFNNLHYMHKTYLLVVISFNDIAIDSETILYKVAKYAMAQ